MKTITDTNDRDRQNERGYVSVAMVAALAVLTAFSLAVAFSHSIGSQDYQAKSQVRGDFAQKEDAVLRSLVTILPNKAMGAMQHESESREDALSWEAIFDEAIDMANAEQAVDSVMLAAMGVSNYVAANTGDHTISSSTDMVVPVVGDKKWVNSGTTISNGLLFDSNFAGKLPDPLEADDSVMKDDREFPIISYEKTFSSSWANDAQLSVSDYPLYNRIAYPNIRFGFKQAGDPVIAKRNWWAFSVKFGQSAGALDLPVLTRNYVISIYEMPAQQPISAEAFMSVGRHGNGQQWSNSQIDGGISAGILRTEGAFSLADGNLTGRSGLQLGTGTTVRGQSVMNGFDDLGVRETAFANAANDQRSVSLAGNSGRVAFIPINRGLDFYRMSTDEEKDTLSPTTWNEYSRGADQCVMKIWVDEVVSDSNQTPTRIYWEYVKSGGGDDGLTLARGDNWPSDDEAGGDLIPFQTEHLENGRDALVVHIDRLEPYLASIGGAPPAVNNSLVINMDDSKDSDVRLPSFPTTSQQCSLVVRDSGDFSSYTEGFSLVTDTRIYFADDFNTVQVTPPANAGLPAGEPFFPPVSIFAPEKRYGTTLVERPVVYRGQVGSLAEGDTQAIHPLDFRVGTYDTVSSDLISTDLREIVSPAELPPIHLMNWLVTVEEIR